MTESFAHRPLVSVVIPAFNEEATIGRAITPLLSDPITDVEIIVADGRSSDGTRDTLAAMSKADPRIRVVDNPQRVTPCGLNAAIAASRGEIIIRMDGHAEPDPGYISACLDILRSSGAWNVGGQMRKVGQTLAAHAASAATTSPFGIGGGTRFHLATDPTDVDSVWLGCWPRWVFERVGLFDPEMVQDQDEELNQRILDAGGRIRFDPSISSAYLSRASWRSLYRQYFRYGMYKIRAIQKRPTVFRPRHLAPAALLGVVVGGIAAGLIGPWGPLLAAAALAAWFGAAVFFARSVAADFETSVLRVVAAFICLHAGYGVGIWVGLIRFAPRWVVDRHGAVPALPPLAS